VSAGEASFGKLSGKLKLVTDPQKMVRAAGKATFKRCEIINSDLVLVEAECTEIMLNKPVAIGFTILEFGKLYMYEFYYDCLLPKFGNKLHLCFTDTDSFICHIETPDLHADMAIWKTYRRGSIRPTSAKTILSFRRQTNASLASSNWKPASVCPRNFAG